MASYGLAVCAVVAAPLMVGSVHLPAMRVCLALGFVACVLLTVAEPNWFYGRALYLRVVIPFGAWALFQLLPLPLGVRGLLDPRGNEFLRDLPQAVRSFSLSLAPRATAQDLASWAGACGVFLVSARLAWSRRVRLDMGMVVAATGLIALVVGLLHRILGIDLLYGEYWSGGPLFPGPFVNPNHSAEFFELAAFCALSSGLRTSITERRILFFALAGLLAGAALATLSRGSLLALAAGLGVFFLGRDRASDEDTGGVARWGVWGILSVAGIAAAALALGAAPIIDELAHSTLSSPEKTAAWFDSIKVLLAHPLGVGPNAFGHVYPIYQTLTHAQRWPYVENIVLQTLLDFGLVGGLMLVGLGMFTGWGWFRRTAARPAERALLAAAAAVVAHNLFDFGIETMGIRAPLAAVLGTLVGRLQGRGREPNVTRRFQARVALALLATAGAVGGWALFHFDDYGYDQALARAGSPAERQGIANLAQAQYPSDYYYALVEAFTQPLTAQGQTGSPRLRSLNRALARCPRCQEIHGEVARSLWDLGRKSQALAEWRASIELGGNTQVEAVLADLDARKAAPVDVIAVIPQRRPIALSFISFLGTRTQDPNILEPLFARAADGREHLPEISIARAAWLESTGHNVEAQAELERGMRLYPSNQGLRAALTHVFMREGRNEAAYVLAREAAIQAPANPDMQALFVRVIVDTKRWDQVDEALDAYSASLRAAGRSVVESHLMRARILQSRGNLARAVQQFQIAANVAPSEAPVWHELATAATAAGNLALAESAWRMVARLDPRDRTSAVELKNIANLRRGIRIDGLLGSDRKP